MLSWNLENDDPDVCFYEKVPEMKPTCHASHAACEWLCGMQRVNGTSIEHVHYNWFTKERSGDEFVPPDWPNKPVDGYDRKHGIIYEYLGDYYHGHPSLWGGWPMDLTKGMAISSTSRTSSSRRRRRSGS